jgi:hypothetical protein
MPMTIRSPPIDHDTRQKNHPKQTTKRISDIKGVWEGMYDLPQSQYCFPFQFLYHLTPIQYIFHGLRKRKFKRILLSVSLVVVVRVVTRIYLFFSDIRSDMHSLIGHWEIKTKPGPDGGNDKAISDSYGFFNSITDDEWDKMRQESLTLIDMQVATTGKTSQLLSDSGADIDSSFWWNTNWKVGCQYIVVGLANIGIRLPISLTTFTDQLHLQQQGPHWWILAL